MATNHGKPRPRYTFTAFDPVIFPIAESALSELAAAVILANVSGRDVPKATIVIAVTDSSIPSTQPSTVANSPTIAVTTPIIAREMKKAGPPFP